MVTKLRTWLDRLRGRRPLEGDEGRAGGNTDAWSSGIGQSGSGYGNAQAHGNIPPNYVPPADEGRPRH